MKKTIVALAMLGAGVLGMSSLSATASAFTVPAQGGVQQSSGSPLLTEVAHRNVMHKRMPRWVSYDRNRHGPRCTRYNNNCRYRYNGFYYSSQWWMLPVVGATVIIGSANHHYGSDHVAWCEDHYRSYNVRTNTWISYSGDVRQCVSPFRN